MTRIKRGLGSVPAMNRPLRERLQSCVTLALLVTLLAGHLAGQDGSVGTPPDEGAPPPFVWRALADPAAAGFDLEGLNAARALAVESKSAAVFAVHRGHVVAAWGDIERRFKCHSVRKSLLSLLYGIAVDGGADATAAVDLDADLAALQIDDRSPLTETEKRARVRDLLAARSGVYHPAAKEPRSMSESRPARGSAEPGAAFFYNNWDFNVAGVVFEQTVGLDVVRAFDRWIAQPLGLEDWRVGDGMFELEPSKSVHPAYAFRLSARDLGRIGWMVACEGRWNRRQIVPAAWVRESTRRHSEFEDGRGYGYMWWVYPAGTLAAYPTLNAHECWAARGTGGQFILVVPSAAFVYVHRGDTDNGQQVRGGAVFGIGEGILAAHDGTAPDEAPATRAVVAEPFEHALPAPEWPTAIALTASQRVAVCGRWFVERGPWFEVYEYAGRLFVRTQDGRELELFASAADAMFSRAGTAKVRVEFSAKDGEVFRSAVLTVRGRSMPAERR